MGLSSLLLVLLASAPQDPVPDVFTWEQAWESLEVLEGQRKLGPEFNKTLLSALLRFGLESTDRARAGLLRTHTDRIFGSDRPDGRRWLPKEDEPWPFNGRESWLVAELLTIGPARTRAVLAALDQTEGALPREQLLFAWNIAVEDAGALRLERGALPVQQRLHDRYRAAWSAGDLALTQGWLGRYEAADALLVEAIDAESAAGNPTGDLWARRGLLALGNGDEVTAEDYLGRGRARGSSDAVQIQAKLDLDRGRISAARRGFCGLLEAKPPVPWARRGWGLTLLPSAPSDRPADAHLSH